MYVIWTKNSYIWVDDMWHKMSVFFLGLSHMQIFKIICIFDLDILRWLLPIEYLNYSKSILIKNKMLIWQNKCFTLSLSAWKNLNNVLVFLKERNTFSFFACHWHLNNLISKNMYFRVILILKKKKRKAPPPKPLTPSFFFFSFSILFLFKVY